MLPGTPRLTRLRAARSTNADPSGYTLEAANQATAIAAAVGACVLELVRMMVTIVAPL